MSEWWTYQLSDFLMFSPRIYWRLVERYNADVWPGQLFAIAAGAALVWLALSRVRRAHRIIAAVLAAAWMWTGWAFHWQRYAPINWAAQYLALAFAVQAALLLAWAVFARGEENGVVSAATRAAGLVLAAAAVLLYPFAGAVAGRPLAQAEVFGLMPEPTALATLGLVLAVPMRCRYGLALIPALSFAAGVLTLWIMAQ
jgi:hypothetical protein